MGIDLATWRARIGLNYYHKCRLLQTRWRSSGGRLYQPGMASWGVGKVMNDIPLVLKGYTTVVALSLILLCSWFKPKGKCCDGKLHCHWQGPTSQVRGVMDGGGILLLKAIVVMIPLLLVMAGDVEENPGPPKKEGTALTLKTAINALHSVCTKWYNIGVQLDIPTFQLKNIEKRSSDSMDQLRDVLDYWMSNDSFPSWSQIVDALKAPSVSENRLAEEIHDTKSGLEEQHSCNVSEVSVTAKCYLDASIQDSNEITPKGISLTATSSGVPLVTLESPTTTTTEHSSSTSPHLSEESQKPPFGCGCDKCTLSSFIESGCPTPIPSASSFPYLKVSGLTHEQQEDLRERLRFESREIMMQFQELVSKTIKSLISQNVPLDELVSHVMTLVAFDPDPVYKKPQVSLFQDCLQKLEAADTIPRVFLVLNNYFSFFNYDIVEHIIEMLGTKNDRENLQSYKEKFDQYARRRIYECGPQFGPESGKDHADIFVKLDSRYDNYTVAEIKGFCRKLSKTLHLSSGGVLRLCRVEKGCIQLTFQVPSFVQQKIFPLSREQEKALKAEGVIKLTCGEYQFPDLTEKPQPSATSQTELIQSVEEQNMAKRSSYMTEGPCSNQAADLRPKKANELRRPDSGFFSAGTTPVTPIKELNTSVQNRDEGWKMTVKAIPSYEKDDLLSAFCCRQENETYWGDCQHTHCHNTKAQLEHFKSCPAANSTTHSCEQCTEFQRSVLSHAMNCRNFDGSCPVPMCPDAKVKLAVYGRKRKSSTPDLIQPPPATLQRKGSVGSFFMKQNLSSAPSYVAACNALTAAGIGSLPSKLVTDLETKVEEIMLQLEKQSLTEDDYRPPESSIPSQLPTLHCNTQSGVSKLASGISEQVDTWYVPSLVLQGTLPPIAEVPEVPSPDVEPFPTSQAVYPLQNILHTLDPNYLTTGRDHFYYQNRDYIVNDVAPLGEEAFGTCVVGQDKFTESMFVIKRNNRADKEEIDWICYECNILARLHGHDNIVRFFGAVMDENEREYPPRVCKVFMEYAENGNLYSLLQDDECCCLPLPIDQSLYYLQQILQAVHYLHSNSILHCDIEPRNVLVFNNGRVVKLTGFGNAIHFDDIPTIKATKLKKCIPFYTAPEVLYKHQPTLSADIWSTLCVFVEMLTAKSPGCYEFLRNQNSMFYLVGSYTDDQIELLVPLSELQLDPSVADLFHKVFQRDHTRRPTALQLLNHSEICNAYEYEKCFDLDYEEEYMEEYEPDQQQQQQQVQQLDSDEDFFSNFTPSSLLNIPEEFPKPGKRVCTSVDSGRGSSVTGSSSCDGSVRDREDDSDFQDEEKETRHPTTRDLYEGEGSAAQCLSPTSPTELQSTGQGSEKIGEDQSKKFFHII